MERKIILIVDDNIKNLQIVGQVLKSEGYSIILVQSAENALKTIKENIPDLFLLDVMMPEMDGYELCQKIKEKTIFKNTPVIFLTAKMETADIVKGFNAGGVDYVTKPFNKEELLIRIKTHIELADSRKKLKAQSDQIHEMKKHRDKMYSIIAHDIRSPLAVITMMLDSLIDGSITYDSADYQYLLGQLSSTTKDTTHLLENLLLWTRNQAGKMTVMPMEFLASDYIQDCISAQTFKIKKKEIIISTEFNDPNKIKADSNMFSTMIRNLLSNAVKFTPKGGTIDIKVLQDNQKTEILIKDTGIGFKPEELEKFQKNILFTNYGTENETGSGLGLSLVKEFAQKNNAILELESKINEGTLFRITFPKS